MTHEELAEAGEALERAAEAAQGEAAEKLRRQARQFETFAESDRGPDHGRLARHQAALRDVRATVDDDVVARIDEANDHIDAHRETLQGV